MLSLSSHNINLINILLPQQSWIQKILSFSKIIRTLILRCKPRKSTFWIRFNFYPSYNIIRNLPVACSPTDSVLINLSLFISEVETWEALKAKWGNCAGGAKSLAKYRLHSTCKNAPSTTTSIHPLTICNVWTYSLADLIIPVLEIAEGCLESSRSCFSIQARLASPSRLSSRRWLFTAAIGDCNIPIFCLKGISA